MKSCMASNCEKTQIITIKYFTCISLPTSWTQFHLPMAIIMGTFSCSPVIMFLLTVWYRTKISSLILWKISSQEHCSLRFSFIKLMWENSCNVQICQGLCLHPPIYFIQCSILSCSLCTIFSSTLYSSYFPQMQPVYSTL